MNINVLLDVAVVLYPTIIGDPDSETPHLVVQFGDQHIAAFPLPELFAEGHLRVGPVPDEFANEHYFKMERFLEEELQRIRKTMIKAGIYPAS